MWEGITSDNSLKNFCTYHTGGCAKRLKFIEKIEDVYDLRGNCVVIGNGSKLLISDNGYDGTVAVMRMNRIFLKDGVYADAGVMLPTLSRFCEANGLSGMEWACGIPGSVGGAVKVCAGAFGTSMAEAVEYAEVYANGQVKVLTPTQMKMEYRKTSFDGIVLGAKFKCYEAKRTEIAEKRKEFVMLRKQKQPEGYSCGSVFVGDEKPAGWYIDRAGLKGKRIGGAVVSEKHANFILNDKNAKSQDIYDLIKLIKEEIRYKYDIQLKEEVVYLGEFN